MTPVAVCRLCVVQVYGQKRGKRAAERKLLPACQHQVKEGMEVFTMNAPGADGERVRKAVGTMTELLMADHLKKALLPEPIAAELAPFNELQRAAERCNLESSRLAADEFKHASAPTPAATSIPGGKSPTPPGRHHSSASSLQRHREGNRFRAVGAIPGSEFSSRKE